MSALSRKRILPYAVAALVVVAVGVWSLRSSGSGDGVPIPAWTSATEGSGGASDQAGWTESDPGGASGNPAGGSDVASFVSTSTTMPPPLFVQVAGAVQRPGVYEVQPGARVFQVLLMAGGMTAEADGEAVPLAAEVGDGVCIRVPRIGETMVGPILQGSAAPAGGGRSGSSTTGPISLSTATEAELDTLPGVGPKTAQRIIAYRVENGPFVSVDQLEEVSGIGAATVERLRDLVVP
ncbi:MAG: helix-hairpin-helix domain-containing protein [Thermoleophilia bacterium]